MKSEQSTGRRTFMQRAGRGLLGLLGVGVAARQAEAGVFAGAFLKERTPVQLPPGYYDAQAQLTRVSATGEAMFVEETAATPLSAEELAEMLRSGRFVDVSGMPRMKVAAATQCTRTTLNTTGGCCPINTDRESDTLDDD